MQEAMSLSELVSSLPDGVLAIAIAVVALLVVAVVAWSRQWKRNHDELLLRWRRDAHRRGGERALEALASRMGASETTA